MHIKWYKWIQNRINGSAAANGDVRNQEALSFGSISDTIPSILPMFGNRQRWNRRTFLQTTSKATLAAMAASVPLSRALSSCRSQASGSPTDESLCKTIENPVRIAEIYQTNYHALGIPPDTQYDIEQRPFYTSPDGKGKAVLDLLARS